MSDNLIHEIEETVRQEKLERLWKEYGVYLIAGAVLVVLFTGLTTGWKSWNDKMNATQTTVVLEALEKEDKIAALNGVIPDLRPDQKLLSYLTIAGLLLEFGKKDEALLSYQAAANETRGDQVLRDLARLMVARLASEKDEKVDSDEGQQWLTQLQALYADETNPWRFHARVQAAVMTAHELQDYVAAQEHLDIILKAENAPLSLLERARSLRHVYALKAIEEKEVQNSSAPEDPKG